METTFYDDTGRSAPLKRPSSLDLGGAPAKRAARGNALLTSPDLHMLKLESPELEKLIIQHHQQPCLYRGEEAPYGDALQGLHQENNAYPTYQPDNAYGYHPQPQPQPQPPASQPRPESACYAAPLYYGVKEEPQTVPCCASPIDMSAQERLKLERKRLRNRIAASKCRRRKLERIARLEDKVAHLKGENAELTGHVTRLKEHVCRLKQRVMEHARAGCEILVAPCHFEHEL